MNEPIILWDEYEIALLINLYEETKKYPESKEQAITNLSKILISRAKAKGLSVSDSFRDVKNIQLQLYEIERAMETKSFNGLFISRTIKVMVDLYKNDNDKFKKFLNESKRDVNTNAIILLKDAPVFNEIDAMYKIQFPELYSKIYSILKTQSKENFGYMMLNEICEFSNINSKFNYVKEILENVSWVNKNNLKYCLGETDGLPTLEIIDFDNIVSLQFSKPYSVKVLGVCNKCLNSWKELYAEFFSTIYENYGGLFYDGISFSKKANARIDFGGESTATKMRAPKRIKNTNYYLETNLNANNIVDKIRYILEFCDISFADVIICFYRNDIKQLDVSFSEDVTTGSRGVKFDENSILYKRLYAISKVFKEPQGLSLNKIGTLIGNLTSRKNIEDVLDSVSWATKLANGVYSFSDNINSVLPFNENNDVDNTVLIDFDKENFTKVLMNRFQSGMQFDSIDLDIFRDTYSLIFDESLSFTDEELEKRLKYCGVIYLDRLFPAGGIIDNTTKERLFSYIENQFAAGKNVLYYKAIFTDLADAFVYCFNLADEEMLKAYLEYMTEGNKYYFFDSYISTEKEVVIDHLSEIVEFMLDAGKPLSYDEVYEGLSHISKDIIYSEIRSNSEFLMNEKEHYFHIDIFEFSKTDGDAIAEILNAEIENCGYVIWSQIFETIKERLPIFIENNLYLSSLGIRNALMYYLSDIYNFDGSVITSKRINLSMAGVYRLFARNHVPFSDNDIYEFSKEVNSPIYFSALAEDCVRVSRTLFVAKTDIQFDVELIDKAIETYLSSGYILFKDVDSFLVFPNVGYEWNEFLLEHYLLYYSKVFSLLNNGSSLNNVSGAISKKNGEFTQFVDVCAHALAESDIELKKIEALNYLADINLITRRSYRDIELAMNKARQIRNRKG